MFNILSAKISLQEMLLLKSLEPKGANLSIHPSEVFSQDYITFVLIAFNEGKPFLQAGSLKKAIKKSKKTLAKMLADFSGNKFISIEVNKDVDYVN